MSAPISARLRWTCPISRAPGDPDPSPLPDAPADRARGALVVTLAEIEGRWRDSPRQSVLVVTHRATGLSLSSAAGPWHPDAAGLRRARAAVAVLLAAPGFDWSAAAPSPAGVDGPAALATLRELLGPLGEPDGPRKKSSA